MTIEFAEHETSYWRQRCAYAEAVADEFAAALAPKVVVGQDTPEGRLLVAWNDWRLAREWARSPSPPPESENGQTAGPILGS